MKIRPKQIMKRLVQLFVCLVLYATILIQYMAPHIMTCAQLIKDELYYKAVVAVRSLPINEIVPETPCPQYILLARVLLHEFPHLDESHG